MRVRRGLFAAAVIACAMVVSSSHAVAAGAAPAFTRYVALGDSYTAGPLIPLPRLNPLGCLRSTDNYPSLLAQKLRVQSFTDISCRGADTTNMTEPQSFFLLGTNPPQFSALRPDTDLVTVGIGGNDYGLFGSLIGTCPELRAEDPTGAPCQEHFTVDGVDTIKAAIDQTRANITEVLRGIHQRAPKATVLAIGYPQIVPLTDFCPDVLPFAKGDYAWLNSVEEALNAAVAKAAADDGNTSYVDTFTPSLGHDACKPRGVAWINGKDTNLLAAAAYHPFRTGMAGVAAVIHQQLTGTR